MPDATPPERTEVQVGGPTVSAATAQGFPTVPGYDIVREVGRGGMGVVYEARQTKLDRTVALKLMLGADPLNKARFLAEGQVIAAVKHPHVVEVYDFGETPVGPFIAMEYLTGGSLADQLRGGPPRAVADQLAKVAAGVGAAHDQGIVHRDLKPGNVLLAADGTPKVTDFGLAKRSTSDLTHTQDAAGTPAYMAPEQARAMKFVGPPADVWSMGVMLYEALTGKRPFVADTDVELLIRIQNDTPTTLRALTRAVPADLETVCLKCLEKEPERRYPTAKDLAADLTAWLAGKPIAARRATTVERVVLWVRRKPMTAAAAAFGALAAVLALFAVTATLLWREAVGEQATAVAARNTAEKAQERAETAEAAEKRAKADTVAERERLAYARNVSLAHAATLGNESRRADEFLALCPEKLRGWDWRYVHRLNHADLFMLKAPGMGYAAALSPDGARVAVGGSPDAAGVWDAATGKQLFPLTPGDDEVRRRYFDRVRHVAFSPDGTRIVSAESRRVWVWDAKTGEQRLAFDKSPHPLIAVRYTPAGLYALYRDEHATAKLWDVTAGAVVCTVRNATRTTSGDITVGAISADGQRLLTPSVDNAATLWDAKTGRGVQAFRGHTDSVEAVAISPDGARVATAARDKTMRLWDAKTGKQLLAFQGATANVKAIAFTPDGGRVVTAAGGTVNPDKAVRVWDAKTGAEEFTFRGHTLEVTSVAIGGDGTRVVTGSYDETVKVWDLTRRSETRVLKGYYGRSLAFSPDGRRLALHLGGGFVHVLDLATGAKMSNLTTGAGLSFFEYEGVAFSPDGTRLLTYGENVEVWDATTGASVFSLRKLGRRGRGVTSAAFTPDGTKVVTAAGFQFGEENFTASVWDIASGAEVLTLRGHTNDVISVAVSPDGSRIATSGNDLTVRGWDATTGEPMFVVHQPPALALAFDATGGRLVTGGADWIGRVLDATTGAAGPVLRGHTGRVTAARFTPDGSRVVTGSWDKSAKVWDAATGNEILTLTHAEAVTDVAVSRDGSRIAVLGDRQPAVYDDRPVSREFLPPAAAPPR